MAGIVLRKKLTLARVVCGVGERGVWRVAVIIVLVIGIPFKKFFGYFGILNCSVFTTVYLKLRLALYKTGTNSKSPQTQIEFSPKITHQ